MSLKSAGKDLPLDLDKFFLLAENHGFYVHNNVSKQRLKVVALEDRGKVIRFFSPEIRSLSIGHELTGSIGIALLSSDQKEVEYRNVIFSHILNWPDLSRSPRILEDTAGTLVFLSRLTDQLGRFPSTSSDILACITGDDNWIKRQIALGRENAVNFVKNIEA
jgi:hypothetical protein